MKNLDKAIIDRDIVIKLVDTPGKAINWDDLQGWHYHSPGEEFDNKFGDPVQPRTRNGYPSTSCCVCIDGGGAEETIIEVKIKTKTPRSTI